MINKIESILDKDIRPYLRTHGGDVRICSFHDGILELKLSGSCSGCLAASDTKDTLITQTLISKLPEVKEVVFNDDIDPELWALAKQVLNHQAPDYIKHSI